MHKSYRNYVVKNVAHQNHGNRKVSIALTMSYLIKIYKDKGDPLVQ